MRKFDPQQDWFRLLIILLGSLVFGALTFIVNNMSGLINLLVTIIQAVFGITFGIWYFRILLAYLREFRKKDEEHKIGIAKGWAIYGIIDSITNIFMWGILSALIFNVPKIIYLIPFAMAMVQAIYILSKANRRKVRDWLLFLYNIVAFLYLLNWTLVDFGIDMPNIVGVFSHTITSNVMWWQFIFVNTGSFFFPVFIFPPYILNPRYYLAMPIEKYYELKEEEEAKIGGDPLRKTSVEIGKTSIVLQAKEEKKLPGERTAFFKERQKLKTDQEIEEAMEREARKQYDEDERFAEFVSLKDFALHFRRLVKRLDSAIRTLSISIILVLIVITPVAFAGNISLNVLPAYDKNVYNTKPGMVLAVQGNVFSNYDLNGNLSSIWQDELIDEINLAKELHVTHLRYDITSQGLANNQTRANLAVGLQNIKDEGIGLILGIVPGYSGTSENLENIMYINCSYMAQTYQPDYMVIYNSINGELQGYYSDVVALNSWYDPITNLTSRIKTLNPSTKVMTTVLAVNAGKPIFENLLTNSTIGIDVVGIIFYPIFFGWRDNILYDYATIAKDANSTVEFWISEIGVETLNFGEDAQAKYLAHIASMCSLTNELNTDGLIVISLYDNLGRSINQGIVSHLGLIYYNGKKKKAFYAITYAYNEIHNP
jgi:hypothetical protein